MTDTTLAIPMAQHSKRIIPAKPLANEAAVPIFVRFLFWATRNSA